LTGPSWGGVKVGQILGSGVSASCHPGGVSVDPSVIAAVEAGVDAAPENVALRLHLVSLLLDSGRAGDALDHLGVVLAREPDNVEGLRLAQTAAFETGEVERAGRYRRLLEALAGEGAAAKATEPSEARSAPPVPAAVPAEGSVVEDEFDAFLREVLSQDDADVERPKVTLADVGGLEEVKRRLTTSFLGPMKNPELRRMYGKSLQGGLLLYGPPGCGKTFLARAVAGELRARFFSVGLHDVLDMWLGKSEQNLHGVFETARRHAPCVLFLDEVDALGLKRSNLSHSAGRNVVVQLLTELDSTRSDNEGLFVLGATNQPWDLDPALRRPGRFDRMLLVLPPDRAAREAIIVFHLRDRPVEDVDVAQLAARTDGYSGADLRLVCESAAESALEASIESGSPRPMGRDDFERALSDVRPSTRPWFEVARNYAMFANEGGVYDDLLAFIKRHRLG
jgi:SpoVK/Ycf46/Vps4 family AAA+-type ATPase